MSDNASNSDQELAANEPKRGRGRLPGFRMTEAHRDKIRNSNILNALIEHAEGKRDMSSTQVTAGLGLIDRVLPKLASTTVAGDDEADPLRVIHTIERRIVGSDN